MGHLVKPAAQLVVQFPPLHTSPGLQLLLQLPQWLGSFCQLVQKPLGPVPQ